MTVRLLFESAAGIAFDDHLTTFFFAAERIDDFSSGGLNYLVSAIIIYLVQGERTLFKLLR